ncbi:MAG: DEAD/DEAH box helicase, partial [Alphaproteobacteria bacterium]|nr:DEAD/DEAH box helicase [Alphaproteobacteria bacterium]
MRARLRTEQEREPTYVTDTTFSGLGVAEPIIRALNAENYATPTPIQAQAIPLLLAGRDLLGIAQTGTGKTAAFVLPILQRLAAETPAVQGRRALRALILAPTRELALQIGERVEAYGRNLGLRHTVILGGVGQGPQVKALAAGVDILIATPGRLLDLLGQNHVRLDRVAYFVLDEADRMLDMGFIRDVRKIVAVLPKARQSLLFSATMPGDVAKLAHDMLRDPARVEVTPQVVTVERIDQKVYMVETAAKRGLLTYLLADAALKRVIVFTRTKHGANKVADHLEKAGISSDAIHGNKSQGARVRALDGFRCGSVRVLVATDIAARGIDVDGITHVVNFDLPNIPESYVHRIGRTARAGADGAAISFCDNSEREYLRDIEKLIRRTLPVAGRVTAQPGTAGQDRASPGAHQSHGQQRHNGHRHGQGGNRRHEQGNRRRRGRNHAHGGRRDAYA